MYRAFNYSVQCIIFCSLFYFFQTEALIGFVREAKDGEFPYAVGIGKIDPRDNKLNFLCAATLISRKHVLTTAYCFKHGSEQNIRIFIGSRDLHHSTPYEMSSWKTYDTWASEKHIPNKFSVNDIAVITLSRLIDERHHRLPNLFHREEQKDPYEKLSVVGWGKSNSGLHNTILQTGLVTMLSKSECDSELSHIEKRNILVDESRFFCTAADPFVLGDDNNGDSGDPVIDRNDVLLGFLVKGYLDRNGPHSEKVNLHIKIDYYKDFIRDMITGV